MPLDAIYLTALADELSEVVIDTKIDKVYQPDKETFVLSLRAQKGNCRLLLSCSAANPRIQLTSETFENPAVPPMLCMLMRKHLMGAKITALRQLPYERVIILEAEGRNELFEQEKKKLFLEIVGRQSNLILCSEEGKILSAVKYSELTEKSGRVILPGAIYQPPKPQEKLAPELENLLKLKGELMESTERADSFLVKRLLGISPLVAREITFQAFGIVDPILSAFGEQEKAVFYGKMEEFIQLVAKKDFKPYLLEDESGNPTDFSYFPILQYGELYQGRSLSSFGEVVDEFYSRRHKVGRLHHRAGDLQKQLTAARERLLKKQVRQEEELEKSKDREHLRIYGELLTASIGQIEKGAPSVRLQNYYDEALAEVSIPLDVKLSPARNAQRYFTLYQKAKNAEGILAQQIEKAKEELEYVDSVLDSLSRVETEAEIQEIRDELSAARVVRGKQMKKGMQRKRQSRPLRFLTSDGYQAEAGKNNTQNDLLTQGADKNDFWFHVQIGAGAHVIVKSEGEEPPARLFTEAAQIAAYYSSASSSAQVPVCYTKACYVKKPAGAKPGKVIYKNYYTAYVTPDEALIKKLKAE